MWAWICLYLLAANDGGIQGRVIDASGGGLRGFVRVLGGGSTKTLYRQSMESDGTFRLSNIPAGTYSVKAQAAGFVEAGPNDVIVEDGGVTIIKDILLPFAGCDAPGVICDSVGPPVRDIIRTGDLFLRRECSADLDSGKTQCSSKPWRDADVRFTAIDNGLYLAPINGAKVSHCDETLLTPDPIRVDGLGPGNNWCFQTNGRHRSHVFIQVHEIQPDAEEIILWQVLRKRL